MAPMAFLRRSLALSFLLFVNLPALGASLFLEGEQIAHHQMNTSSWHTPIASVGDEIYYVYVDRELRTVVAQKSGGVWRYQIIEAKTRLDAYHTLPSIGIDEAGYIHVVYNMHSTPWQYKRSKRPRDISEWDFLGQYAGDTPGAPRPDLSACSGTCKSDWYGRGTAAIPGNQITYPVFTNDRSGRLYLAYRECGNCAATSYFDRNWSAGISVYDVSTGTWQRVQGRMFASDPGKLPLGISMFFDVRNRMHVAWAYGFPYDREIGAANYFENPSKVCYVYSDDGGKSFISTDGMPVVLPIDYSSAPVALGHGWVSPHTNGYYSGTTAIAATSTSFPHILVFPRTTSETVYRGVRFHDGTMWRTIKKAAFGGAAQIHINQVSGEIATLAGEGGIRLSRARSSYDSWFTETFYASAAPFKLRLDGSFAVQTEGIRFLALDQNGLNDSKVMIFTVHEGPGADGATPITCTGTP